MSATNRTPNFELPLFIGTDIPSWLSDWNGSMNSIDTAMQTIKTTANGAASGVSGNTSDIETINGQITTINSTLTNLGNSVQALSTNMNAFHRSVITNPNSTLFTGYAITTKWNKPLGYLSIYGAMNVNDGQSVVENTVIANIGTVAAPGITVTLYNGCSYVMNDNDIRPGILSVGTNGNVSLIGVPSGIVSIRVMAMYCMAGNGNGWPGLVS